MKNGTEVFITKWPFAGEVYPCLGLMNATVTLLDDKAYRERKAKELAEKKAAEAAVKELAEQKA